MRDRVKLIVNNKEIQKRYLGNRLVWEAIRFLYTTNKYITLSTIYITRKQGKGFILQNDFELNKYVEKTRQLVFRLDKTEQFKIEVESVLKTNNTVYFYLSQNEYDKAKSNLEKSNYLVNSWDIDLYGS